MKINIAFIMVSTLVILACVWAGYEIAQPEGCCSYPGNRQLIDYVAAWSGPVAAFAAILIAIVNDFRIQKRFEKQITAQMSLDGNADKRQQDEWDKARKQKNAEADSLNEFMVLELQKIIKDTFHLEAQISRSDNNYMSTYTMEVSFSRPFAAKIIQQYSIMQVGLIHAIIQHEEKFSELLDEMKKFKNQPLYSIKIGDVSDLRMAALRYIMDIKNIPDEFEAARYCKFKLES